jgi:two-component system, OmpR family, sensor kinase
MLSHLPIRVRMTAAFALTMVLVLAAAALFVYLRQRADLDEAINSGLHSRSDDVAAFIGQSGPSLTQKGAARLTESGESFVQILTPDGRWVDGTSPVRRPALRPDEARRAARSPTTFERSVPGIDAPARIFARFAKSGERSLVVVTGAQLEDRNDALAGLLKSFLIGGPIAVLVASLIGYGLATVGLRPVEAMRKRAERISLARGDERLPLPVAQDEVRRLGETLNEMLARLESSLERERKFVADAGHELRTPIAVAKTELETAIRGAGEEEIRLSVVSALEEMDHLAQLAEDLLLIAQAADGQIPVRREQVQVRAMLERAQERFADRAREQRREILVHAPGDLPAYVDPLRMRQAIGNLVDNALRHGRGDIHLSAGTNGKAVEIDVTDDGPGFSADVIPHAFDRFVRGGERTRGGAGLGLAIVRTIAEAHGGAATIVADHSGRTAVRLRIPLAQASS